MKTDGGFGSGNVLEKNSTLQLDCPRKIRQHVGMYLKRIVHCNQNISGNRIMAVGMYLKRIVHCNGSTSKTISLKVGMYLKRIVHCNTEKVTKVMRMYFKEEKSQQWHVKHFSCVAVKP